MEARHCLILHHLSLSAIVFPVPIKIVRLLFRTCSSIVTLSFLLRVSTTSLSSTSCSPMNLIINRAGLSVHQVLDLIRLSLGPVFGTTDTSSLHSLYWPEWPFMLLLQQYIGFLSVGVTGSTPNPSPISTWLWTGLVGDTKQIMIKWTNNPTLFNAISLQGVDDHGLPKILVLL